MAGRAGAVSGALGTALGGLAALAAAMGIGRFLLTPALPMMAEGTGLSPSAAGLVAAANFAGYLAGALALGWVAPGIWARGVLALSLAASAASTAAMAATADPLAWAALRALGGAASAAALVTATTLVLGRLGAAGRPGLAAVHFGGVGAGIALSALLAAPGLAAADGWRQVWATGGAAALALAVPALLLAPRPAPAPPVPAGGGRAPWRLVAAYGCLGFGYVVLATFLVTILREGGAGRAAETALWLAVGLAAAPSVALWSFVGRRLGAVQAFRLAMWVQAAGVAIGVLGGGTAALAVAAVTLGGTFMGLTALGLAEAARRAGPGAARALGLMTASFGAGQMAGPAVAGALREATGGFAAAGLLAAALLIAGAGLLGPLRREGGFKSGAPRSIS